MYTTCQSLDKKRKENRKKFALLCGLTRNLRQRIEKQYWGGHKKYTCEAISLSYLLQG